MGVRARARLYSFSSLVAPPARSRAPAGSPSVRSCTGAWNSPARRAPGAAHGAGRRSERRRARASSARRSSCPPLRVVGGSLAPDTGHLQASARSAVSSRRRERGGSARGGSTPRNLASPRPGGRRRRRGRRTARRRAAARRIAGGERAAAKLGAPLSSCSLLSFSFLSSSRRGAACWVVRAGARIVCVWPSRRRGAFLSFDSGSRATGQHLHTPPERAACPGCKGGCSRIDFLQ